MVKTFESDMEAMADDEYDESEVEMKRRTKKPRHAMD